MKKINSERLCVEISLACFIDANKLQMYNISTGETKFYSEIDESDIVNWVVNDSVAIMNSCDEVEHDRIDIVEA